MRIITLVVALLFCSCGIQFLPIAEPEKRDEKGKVKSDGIKYNVLGSACYEVPIQYQMPKNEDGWVCNSSLGYVDHQHIEKQGYYIYVSKIANLNNCVKKDDNHVSVELKFFWDESPKDQIHVDLYMVVEENKKLHATTTGWKGAKLGQIHQVIFPRKLFCFIFGFNDRICWDYPIHIWSYVKKTFTSKTNPHLCWRIKTFKSDKEIFRF